MKKSSLKDTHPSLAKEWHSEKNGELQPSQFTFGSRKRIWWKCSQGDDHIWEAPISRRTKGHGCPYCSGTKTAFSNSISSKGKKLLKSWDYIKNKDLNPSDIYYRSTKKVWWQCPKGDDHKWKATIVSRIEGNGCPICRGLKVVQSNSLSKVYPEIALEWHYSKNQHLTPSTITPGSGKKVWWKCDKGEDHEWQSSPSSRVRGGGCPYCQGKKSSKTNSLLSLHPKTARLWHETRNLNLTPSSVTAGSDKKVWWKCPEGDDHEWENRVRQQVKSQGCPICNGKRIVESNSFFAKFPELTKEWHKSKNGNLSPKKISPGSHKRIWWHCSKDETHIWKSSVKNRTYNGQGCPYCSGNRADSKTNLAVEYPELLLEWHNTKNQGLEPKDFRSGSSKKVWWKCPEGDDHEWKATISSRTRGNGCPICRGFKVVNSNSLATLNPTLAKEWHPELNDLSPKEVTLGSRKMIWWRCTENPEHYWKASVLNRSHGAGCAVCAGQQTIPSTSLQATYPSIASEWHPTLNGNLTPSEIQPYSGRKVWWKCNKGEDHEWESTVANRVNGNGCSVCYGQTVVQSNCLSTTHPKIAKQWHKDLNTLTPEEVVAGSDKKIWWQCENNPAHIWKTSIGQRTRGNNCPYCELTPQSRQELTITFELLTIFNDIDPQGFKLHLNGKLRAIDIFIPSLNVCIEFDGSYWHKDKRSVDKIKSELILEEGFKLIRIREEPLKRITSNDIISSTPFDGKVVTDNVLKKIDELFKIDEKTKLLIDEYLKQPNLTNEKSLDEYISALLSKKYNLKDPKKTNL